MIFQVWAPPTPPSSENDIYLDPCLAFWFEPSIMHESRLPPVFIKREPKRQHVDPVVSGMYPCNFCLLVNSTNMRIFFLGGGNWGGVPSYGQFHILTFFLSFSMS